MDNFLPPRLLSRKEAARFLGVAEATLAIWVTKKRYQLPIVKVGRLVKYRLSDLIAFVERQTISSKSDNSDLGRQ